MNHTSPPDDRDQFAAPRNENGEPSRGGDARAADAPRPVGRLSHPWTGVVLRTAVSLTMIGLSVGAVLALGSARPPQTESPGEPPLPVVEAVPVVVHREGIDFDVDGVVIPFQQVGVPAEVAGRIVRRAENCRIGRFVSEDQVLVEIDPEEYDLEVKRLDEQRKQAEVERRELQLELAQQKRQIELAEENLAIKQREVRRYERIEQPGIYSQAEMDTARWNELQARDALQTEKDRLELLEARLARLDSAVELAARQLDKARLDLARTRIRAPIDGILTTEPVERGSYVQRGGIVAVIQDTSCMEVKCSLQMHQMHWLWQSRERPDDWREQGYRFPRTPVTVIYATGDSEYRWEGVLADYAGMQVDEKTRMVPCRVLVEQPDQVRLTRAATLRPAAPPALMTGMFVTVRVHARPKVPLFCIPETAVQPGNKVWLVRDLRGDDPRTGRLRHATVAVAYAAGGSVLAVGGDGVLAEGDLVVSSPLSSPDDGMAVRLLAAEGSPRPAAAEAAP